MLEDEDSAKTSHKRPKNCPRNRRGFPSLSGWLSHLSVGQKIFLGYFFVLSIAAAGTASGIAFGNRYQNEAIAWEQHIQQEIELIYRLQNSMLHARARQQQLVALLHSREAFLKEYEHFLDDRKQVLMNWSEARKFLKDMVRFPQFGKDGKLPLREKNRERLEDYFAAVSRLADTIARAPLDSSENREGLRRQLVKFSNSSTAASFDGVLDELGSLMERTHLEYDGAATKMQKAGEVRSHAILFGMLSSVAIAVWSALATSRSICRPLQQVTETAERVRRESNFDLRVPVAANDEVGSLALSFNHALERVKQLVLAQKQEVWRQLELNRLLRSAQAETEAANLSKNQLLSRIGQQNRVLANLAKDFDLHRGNLQASLHKVTEATARALQVNRASVWAFDASENEIACLDLYETRSRSHVREIELSLSLYPGYLQALATEELVAADDARKDPRTCELAETYLEPFDIYSTLSTWVLQDGKKAGLICLEATGTARNWSLEDRSFARSLADIVALAIASSKRQEIERQLVLARDAADAANRAKSEFLANMSHELRTPLNGILGYAQILERDRDATPKQKKGAKVIQSCGKHLLSLIEDILEISKIESSPMELRLVDFLFQPFLVGVVEAGRARAARNDVEFSFSAEGALPAAVRGDEKRLRQALTNAIVQAIASARGGSVTLQVAAIEREKGAIVDSPETAATSLPPDSPAETIRTIRFQVRSAATGAATGATSARNETVFTFFEPSSAGKAPSSEDRPTEEIGFSLAIARKLLQMMGGELQVESYPGRGSCFWFDIELPEIALRAELVQQEASRRVTGYVGAKRKILVVDDRWESRSAVLNLLEPLGFETIEAENGQEGIEKARQHAPDAILTDLVMPVLDGFETIRRLRRMPEFRDAAIVATSASTLSCDRRENLCAGSNEFLLKPVSADRLLEVLQRLLRLEWIYEGESSPLSIPASSSSDAGPSAEAAEEGSEKTNVSDVSEEWVAPPPKTLHLLYDLARKGLVDDLSAQAEEIARSEARFAPFARRVQELARDFQTKKIRQLVEQHL